ncbi:MAG: PAS domain-containing protein [Desulfobulbaceae bacterium]|nr:PAS domain-containing protein [Desulfobulbaceae bacterium]
MREFSAAAPLITSKREVSGWTLNSTNIATIFLDDGLRLRRFTTQAVQFIKLIPSDIGRPITDIASTLIYPELPTDTLEVLQTLVFKEKPVATTDGRCFSARVMPYRTQENKIDGVVITFTDITLCKKLEGAVQEFSARERQILENSSDAFFFLDSSLAIISCNLAAERMFGRNTSEVQGKLFTDLFPETKKTLSGKMYCQAIAEKSVQSFEYSTSTAHCPGSYRGLVYPQTEDILVSLQRSESGQKQEIIP